MKKNWTIFNSSHPILLAAAILVGAIIAKATAPIMPNISSAWLVFCLLGCIILYAKGVKAWHAKEADEGHVNDPNLLIKSLDQSIDKQVQMLRRISDLSTEDMAMIGKVEEAITQKSLELYLQPIVTLENQETSYYEAFSRLREANGHILRPADYLGVVERANKIGFIDNVILLRSVETVRNLMKTNKDAAVFCNISPATLYDQNFFALFTQYLDNNTDIAPNLIFEFTYPAISLVDPTIAKSLDMIAERGFGFSIDHINRFDMDFSIVKKMNVGFVKVPIQLILGATEENEAVYTKYQTMRETLDKHNIQIVAEKVESNEQLKAISRLDISFGQGNYFGVPMPAMNYLEPNVPLKKAS